VFFSGFRALRESLKKLGKTVAKSARTHIHRGINYFDGHIPTFYRTWIRLYRGTKTVKKNENKMRSSSCFERGQCNKMDLLRF
jgi:hypothetical protein